MSEQPFAQLDFLGSLRPHLAACRPTPCYTY
jgi:hypothetical protein